MQPERVTAAIKRLQSAREHATKSSSDIEKNTQYWEDFEFCFAHYEHVPRGDDSALLYDCLQSVKDLSCILSSTGEGYPHLLKALIASRPFDVIKRMQRDQLSSGLGYSLLWGTPRYLAVQESCLRSKSRRTTEQCKAILDDLLRVPVEDQRWDSAFGTMDPKQSHGTFQALVAYNTGEFVHEQWRFDLSKAPISLLELRAALSPHRAAAPSEAPGQSGGEGDATQTTVDDSGATGLLAGASFLSGVRRAAEPGDRSPRGPSQLGSSGADE